MNFLQKITLILLIGIPSLSQGCLWDSDTLASESARFPDVAGILTGLFPRHSKEYHTWRIQQKKPLVEAGSATASDFDDLAVSQHKLGDHQAAIATMVAKEKLMPGKYETYSNLGTFYIYTGELRTATQWIEKALAINANAHFGREKYQRYLVMWLRENRSTVKTKEESEADRESLLNDEPQGFAAFVARQEMGGLPAGVRPLFLAESQRDAAIRGVTGMMYFADFDNPLLQEALGDLLAFGNMSVNASQLAGLCYLQASQKTAEPDEKARLKMLMLRTLSASHLKEEAQLLKTLKKALGQGEALNKDVRKDEMAWLAAGKDATLEFQKKYLQAVR